LRSKAGLLQKNEHKVPDQWKLRSIIDKALATLATHEAIDPENIWLSQDDELQDLNMPSRRQSIHPGLGNGISGILFLLARATRLGHDISPYIHLYHKNWDYVKLKFLDNSSPIGPSLIDWP